MRLFFGKRSKKPEFTAPLEPEAPFFAVGDIHGRDDLFARLMERLSDLAHPTAPLICVGDYIDRGDDSAALLRRLHDLQAEAGSHMVCLRGNHEAMLLKFLDEPARHGPRWLRHGGLQTLASYRIAAVRDSDPAEKWEGMRDRLREAMGADIENWLRGLPLTWQTGNVLVCHAGADPSLGIEDQSEDVLLWGHEAFMTTPREDGIWVVYGHTICDRPRPEAGRIPVDTGAYATGRLTAALIEPGRVEFFFT